MVQRKPLSDLVGKKFNRLTVVEYLGPRKHRKHWWLCECECGGSVELNTSSITSNNPTKSCGCLRKETVLLNRPDPHKHGFHKHPLYSIWHGMNQRCYNPKNDRYIYYGLKGIKIEEDFSEVVRFITWGLENGWEEGLTIDRVNSHKNYTASNCEWVTRSENSRRMNESRRNEAAT